MCSWCCAVACVVYAVCRCLRAVLYTLNICVLSGVLFCVACFVVSVLWCLGLVVAAAAAGVVVVWWWWWWWWWWRRVCVCVCVCSLTLCPAFGPHWFSRTKCVCVCVCATPPGYRVFLCMIHASHVPGSLIHLNLRLVGRQAMAGAPDGLATPWHRLTDLKCAEVIYHPGSLMRDQ